MSRNKKAFTLLELIVVIIIVGILATLGLTTYTNQIEYARTAEAKANIATMRKLAYEYYLKNGSLTSLGFSDVSDRADRGDGACYTTGYYAWGIGYQTSEYANLAMRRCASNGKSPNTNRQYDVYLKYYPGTGSATLYCDYIDDHSGCFGLPGGISGW